MTLAKYREHNWSGRNCQVDARCLESLEESGVGGRWWHPSTRIILVTFYIFLYLTRGLMGNQKY